jgi:putative oxidoreductase
MQTDDNAIVRKSGVVHLATRILGALDRTPFSIVQLLIRVSIGAVFWSAGLTKIKSWPATVALFQNEYHVPLITPTIAASMATAVELSCPILLFLGLGTRLATVPMLVQSFVIAVFVYPEEWVEHLTWASLLLALLVRGPGSLALDHLIKRHF